jgi:hypothetical protein
MSDLTVPKVEREQPQLWIVVDVSTAHTQLQIIGPVLVVVASFISISAAISVSYAMQETCMQQNFFAFCQKKLASQDGSP